jgi:metal transporter CNNM
VPSLSSSSPPRELRKTESTHSSDTLGSLRSQNGSPIRRKRGAARSGSITETFVDTGGVRKVVLEANSSSSDDKDDHRSSRVKSENKLPNSSTTALSTYDEHTEESSAPKGEEVKKKRKRNRKKKGASNKSAEETALLGEGSNQ